MAGRFKGNTGTLTREQLENMGCYGKAAANAQVVAVPPPTYPALATIPLPIQTCPNVEYKVSYKQKYINKMRTSPYHLKSKGKLRVHHRDNYVVQSNNFSAKELEMMPTELHIVNNAAKNQLKAKGHKNSETINIVSRLEQLEKKDNLNDKTGSNKSDTSSEGICEDDDFAHEIDEENDYENCYFDNGEAYNEEDDNVDDGPVY